MKANSKFDIFQSSPYGWLMLSGIFVSIALWSRMANRARPNRVHPRF